MKVSQRPPLLLAYLCLLGLHNVIVNVGASPVGVNAANQSTSSTAFYSGSYTSGPVSALYGPNTARFAVQSLPHIDFPVPRSWAGNIPIGPGYGNDSLYFWLWEGDARANGAQNEDLIIWFQGGPACSSLLGLFKEHGPAIFVGNSTSLSSNPYSWTKLANMLYVDQPVGTGFSYGSPGATDNAQDTADFVQWLSSFAVFPGMRSKNIHLMGESFAGIFIPYIAKATQNNKHLGINIKSIGLGDAAWGNAAALTDVVATTYLKNHAHTYGTRMPADVLAVLEQTDQDCGFTSVLSQLTYPPLASIEIPGNPENSNYKLKVRQESAVSKRNDEFVSSQGGPRPSTPPGYDPDICDFDNGTHTADQLLFLINGTDPNNCYGGCATYDAAFNWLADAQDRCFNPYNIAGRCGSGLYSDDAYVAYLNLPEVKKAIHAPDTLGFQSCNADLEFDLSSPEKRVEPPSYSIIPGLLAEGIEVNIWAGKLDYILIHLGQQLVIQNMTWNGAQGFQKKPNIHFFDALGHSAGVFGAERGLNYYLFHGAGHRVPQDQPSAAFEFVKDRVIKL